MMTMNLSLRNSAALVAIACLLPNAMAQQTASASFLKQNKASATLTPVQLPPAACERPLLEACSPPVRSKPRARKKAVAKVAPFDALAVHPDVAVRDTPATEIVLPGVMKIAGADAHALDFKRARVIQMTNGGSEVVYLSVMDQNRIQLPWPGARVNGTEELIVDQKAKSNNVYVQFAEGVTRPVQVYFEQPGGSGSVLGLQLVPKKIPAQTILVQDNSLLKGESIKPPKSNDYVAQTQALLETVALGEAPQGYSEIELKLPLIAMNGLVVRAERLFSSGDRDIYVYDVLNPHQKVVNLQEKEFDGDSVLAISIYPKPLLGFNEHAKVLVISRKQKEG